MFADEPILEVTAPLIEAQLVETFLINPIALPDDGRLEGGPGGAGLRRPPVRRLLGPARPRRRRRAEGGAGGRSSAARRRRRSSRRAGGTASRSAARWPTPTSCRSPTSATAFRAYARDFPRRRRAADRHLRHGRGRRSAAAVAAGAGRRGDHGSRRCGSTRATSRRWPSRSGPVLDDAGLHRRRDPRLGRPRRVPHRRAGRGRRARSTRSGSAPASGTSDDAPSLGAVYKLVEDEAGRR